MWDPFRDLDRLMSGLGRSIGNASGSFISSFSTGRWSIDADVVEGEGHYRIIADLPGMRKEDVSVHYDEENRQICIAGEREIPGYHRAFHDNLLSINEQERGNCLTNTSNKPADGEDTERPLLIERDFGRFERCFRLPGKVNHHKIEAKFENSVLTVSLEKSGPSSFRQSDIVVK